MFSYDLVSRHRVILGEPNTFAGCEHHLDPAGIPLAEATRLLFNRCSGLLLVKELLCAPALSREESEFIGRNLAKARLGLGDAVLTAARQYVWSCRERHARLRQLKLEDKPPPWMEQVLAHHASGVEFKLHPCRIEKPLALFHEEHQELSAVAVQIWLWIESRRLQRPFATAPDYMLSGMNKCSGTNPARNWILNLRTFGARGALEFKSWRYPRERLLNSLPVLLSNGELPDDVVRQVQRELHATGSSWPALVSAYKRIWPSYG